MVRITTLLEMREVLSAFAADVTLVLLFDGDLDHACKDHGAVDARSTIAIQDPLRKERLAQPEVGTFARKAVLITRAGSSVLTP